jgi:hypothetical protein
MATSVLPEARSETCLRLHHGTDVNSGQDLEQHGVDQAHAAVFNISGEFWATTSAADAETFAQVNPAGGVPARYSFDLPLWVLQMLLTSNPPRAYQHTTAGAQWYEFRPGSYPLLNLHMTNREVVSPVP